MKNKSAWCWGMAAMVVCLTVVTGCSSRNGETPEETVGAEVELRTSFFEVNMIRGEREISIENWLAEGEMSAAAYSVVDLDGDGAAERILRLARGVNEEVGFLILQEEGDAVYGHMLSNRQFGQLKQDGTFSFSGGVSNHGVGRLVFGEGDYTVTTPAYCESVYPNTDEISYYIDGQSAAKEAFDDYVSAQSGKPDAEWLPVTR